LDQEFVAGANDTLSKNPIRSGFDIESLRGWNLKVYLMGEPVDHPTFDQRGRGDLRLREQQSRTNG